jgi:hypothetical protein
MLLMMVCASQLTLTFPVCAAAAAAVTVALLARVDTSASRDEPRRCGSRPLRQQQRQHHAQSERGQRYAIAPPPPDLVWL